MAASLYRKGVRSAFKSSNRIGHVQDTLSENLSRVSSVCRRVNAQITQRIHLARSCHGSFHLHFLPCPASRSPLPSRVTSSSTIKQIEHDISKDNGLCISTFLYTRRLTSPQNRQPISSRHTYAPIRLLWHRRRPRTGGGRVSTGEDVSAQRRTRSYSTILSCFICQLYLDRQDGSLATIVMPLRPHLPLMDLAPYHLSRRGCKRCARSPSDTYQERGPVFGGEGPGPGYQS